jgi:type II secretory pathway pseudopilin PulG
MQTTNHCRGAALLVITISVILLAISLSVALPAVKNDLRRDKEDRLRFILAEFRRAVEKYRICNRSFPEKIDDLLSDDKGNRFLRQKYPDPFTGNFDWQYQAASESFVVFSISSQTSLAGVPYSQFR